MLSQFSGQRRDRILNAGGAIHIAQRIAGHSQLSTTQIYDRSKDRVTIAEIER